MPRPQLALCLFAGTGLWISPAAAQTQNDGLTALSVALGTLGGITNSIAAAVYSVEGRAFGSGWIVSSLFSTAICGGLAGSLLAAELRDEGGPGVQIGLVLYAFLAAWPGYYVVRTALTDAEPGEYFDAEIVRRPTRPPLDGPTRVATGRRLVAAWSFGF